MGWRDRAGGERRRAGGSDAGHVLILVLVATGVTGVLAAGLLAALAVESRIALTFQETVLGRHAAEAGIEVALLRFKSAPVWDDVLSGGMPSPSRAIPGIDVGAETARLQAGADPAGTGGPDVPRWQVIGFGPVSAFVPGSPDARSAVLVWVADDPADGDGEPTADRNGEVLVHALAVGPRGTRRALRARVRRGGSPDAIRVVAWQFRVSQ